MSAVFTNSAADAADWAAGTVSMFSGVRCSALTVDGQLFRSRKVSGGLLVSEEALGRPVTVLSGTQSEHLPSP